MQNIISAHISNIVYDCCYLLPPLDTKKSGDVGAAEPTQR